MLTSNDKSWMRDYISSNMLPSSCVIRRDTGGTVNAYFEHVPGVSIIGTVACRVDPFNRQDSGGMVADADKTRSYYRLTVPYDADIQSNDTITFNSLDYSIFQLHDNHDENLVKRAVIAMVE